MEKVTLLPPEKLVNGWIHPSFLPEGKDKYYLRNEQTRKPQGGWRHLTSDEIEQLVRNANTASSWDTVYVTDEFTPFLVKNNKFFGTVRIGRVSDNGLQFHDLRLPVGITNSSIHSCDIGNDCAIHDVHYLSHYIIGDHCMLFNIHEMSSTDHAKFGNGVVKDGESEKVRVRMEIMNETGCRAVYPFDGMTTADAYLWARYVDDSGLQQKLREMTQNVTDSRRGYYGTVGDCCVIKTSEILKDAKIGPHCYIKGASKLKNITIKSSENEPTQIGENVILVNGIVGYGCHIFYGCTAVKFVVGNNCNLKYGARIIDSVLGDNSTISCCEVLNNLIFPAHEQHHNNSFLIASCVKGQSNLAAGATIGSNHNSRTNDNEIVAGRGFWPGLCTSVKHSSVFASFTLLAKGAYPAELHVRLPFSMLSNNEKDGELDIMPAFWWLYNMYALARNSWKFRSRDKRITKTQNIEFDTYAPDSMEEVIEGRSLLAQWTAEAWAERHPESPAADGAALLDGDPSLLDGLEVFGKGVEKSRRPVRIVKYREAWHAYADMLIHYGMECVLSAIGGNPDESLRSITARFASEPRCAHWVNLGGQLVREQDVDTLRADIRSGKLRDWHDIHARYDELWERYPEDKLCHAYRCLCHALGVENMDKEAWQKAIDEEIRIRGYICSQVRRTREKDYENPFRRATYRNGEEMTAAIGTLDDNSFVRQIKAGTEECLATLSALMTRY